MATVTFKHANPEQNPKFQQGDWATRINSLVLVTGNGITKDHFAGVVIKQGNLDLLPGDERIDFCNQSWDQFHGEINIKT